MMGTVVPETCSAYKKYSKIVKWRLVGYYSSVTTMMHGPTNIKFTFLIVSRSVFLTVRNVSDKSCR